MTKEEMIFECEYCGGKLIKITEGQFKCDHCGSIKYVETTTSNEILMMFNQANTLRNKGEFDDAYDMFENISTIDKNNPDAYFGMFLCEYGIMHVKDPITSKYIPTCNRGSDISVYDDENYKMAISLSSEVQVEDYLKRVEQIEAIRKRIIQLARNESSYDIFICYKRTANSGGEETLTQDSEVARDMYEFLVSKGYKVFFAQKTLQNLAGTEYEPLIYNALNTSKLMLVVGSKPEYINAAWVKNEWRRFLKQMQFDESKKIVPIMCGGMKAGRLPDLLKKFQGLELDFNFKENLLGNVTRCIDMSKQSQLKKKKFEDETNLEKEISIGEKLTDVWNEVKEKVKKKYEEFKARRQEIREQKQIKLAEKQSRLQEKKSRIEEKRQQDKGGKISAFFSSVNGLSKRLLVLLAVSCCLLIAGIVRSQDIVMHENLLNYLSIFLMVGAFLIACVFELKKLKKPEVKIRNLILQTIGTFLMFASAFMCVAYFVFELCEYLELGVPFTNHSWLYMFLPFGMGFLTYTYVSLNESVKQRIKASIGFSVAGVLAIVVAFCVFQPKINIILNEKYIYECIEVTVSENTNSSYENISFPVTIKNTGKKDIVAIDALVIITDKDNFVLGTTMFSINDLLETNVINHTQIIFNSSTAQVSSKLFNADFDALRFYISINKVRFENNVSVQFDMNSSKIIKEIDFSNTTPSSPSTQTQQEQRYSEAMSQMSHGNFEGAKQIFLELGLYRDSAQKVQECNLEISYQEALDLFEANNFNAAKLKFEELGNFKDSQVKAVECENGDQYLEALNLFDRGEYGDAKVLFESLGTFKDSPTQVQNCIYQIRNLAYTKAMGYYYAGYLKEAYEIFKDIGYEYYIKDIESIVQTSVDKYIAENKYKDVCEELDIIGLDSTNSELYRVYNNASNGLYSDIINYYGWTTFNVEEGTTEIKDGAFAFAENLEYVELPEGLLTIGVDAFDHCTNLKEIVIPSSVTSIGEAAFASCTSITELVIPNSVISIGNNCLNGCENLAEISLPLVNGLKMQNLYFAGVDNSVPEVLRTINITGGTIIGEGAFRWCKGLTELNIQTNINEIKSLAFFMCKNLKTIEFPSSLNIIEDDAFSDAGFESLEISSVELIGDRAFTSCNFLREITLSTNLGSFGECCFQTSGLKVVNFLGTKEEWLELLSNSSSNWDSYMTTSYSVICSDYTYSSVNDSWTAK